VPPQWGERDWFEEISAEASAAAMQAWRDYDPSRGVPWEAFLRRRVMSTALTRYRREWGHAMRQVSLEVTADLGSARCHGLPPRETVARLIAEALGRLPPADAVLIERLYWDGKTEAGLAADLGITQQAVNKRKRVIFRTLHRVIETLAKDLDSWL
jgi:DNA-directed RNA polymerase specialized sigma24 family protein